LKLDTFVDTLHLAEKITGVPAPRMQVALSIMKMMAATMGVVEKIVPVPPDYSSEYLRTVQKNLTVPHQQKGPVLSSLRSRASARAGSERSEPKQCHPGAQGDKAKSAWGYNPRPLEDGLTETLRHEMQLLGMK
jgi:hypothetical protein